MHVRQPQAEVLGTHMELKHSFKRAILGLASVINSIPSEYIHSHQ